MSRRWKKTVCAAITAVAALVGSSALGTSTAMAAPCTYAGCNGKDPQATGCGNDAVTKLEFSINIAVRVQLRWSPTCHAFWTRVVTAPENNGQGQYGYIAGGSYDANGKAVTQIVYRGDSTGAGPSWTKMISQAYPWERFCGYSANDPGKCQITTL